jgi:DNA-binding response OmpR family regulator
MLYSAGRNFRSGAQGGVTMYRIFIVEDDAVIAGAIRKHIESWGWQARCVSDFGNVRNELLAFDPQLVLLDISLLSSTAITGAPRFAGSPKSPLCFFPPPRII